MLPGCILYITLYKSVNGVCPPFATILPLYTEAREIQHHENSFMQLREVELGPKLGSAPFVRRYSTLGVFYIRAALSSDVHPCCSVHLCSLKPREVP